MTLPSLELVKRARRSLDAARALFRDGMIAECHQYMMSALELLVEAWGGSATAPSELERLRYRRVERLRAVLDAPLAVALSDARGVDWIWAEIERLASFSVRRARTPRERRVRRWGAGIGAALVVVIALVFAVRLWGRPRVRASGFISVSNSADMAYDGLEATEWLLGSKTGWIDVIFSSPRSVHGVQLVNSHNRFYLDRASRAVRVTAFNDSGRGASIESAFTKITQERSALDLPLEATGVTRVRVEILSCFGESGGLAEIVVR